MSRCAWIVYVALLIVPPFATSPPRTVYVGTPPPLPALPPAPPPVPLALLTPPWPAAPVLAVVKPPAPPAAGLPAAAPNSASSPAQLTEMSRAAPHAEYTVSAFRAALVTTVDPNHNIAVVGAEVGFRCLAGPEPYETSE